MPIEERVIRWSEIRLPHPSREGVLVPWKVDGPFALRSYYRIDGSRERIELDLSHRREDGTLAACLHCGSDELSTRVEAPWAALAVWGILGVGLAAFTWGVSLLIAAYPLWFLWSGAPRAQKCGGCEAEFVDFRHGPRP